MMDSMMNASFLFWGGQQLNKPEIFKAGLDHTRTTEQLLIRGDGSSYHHYQFDPVTSAPMRGITFQGNADESCWSRGHSWGVYGFPIAYSYAKEPFIKEVHRHVVHFMLNHLPEDCIPYWDYNFMAGEQPRDSSAACISACGLHEMCKHLSDDDPDKAIFESAGAQMRLVARSTSPDNENEKPSSGMESRAGGGISLLNFFR
jgi:unsaturated chondroitin disaccharide hydrolase